MELNNPNLILMNLSSLKNLQLEDGIYYTKSISPISYPDEWNNYCYQIEADSFWFKHRNQCIIALAKKYLGNRVFFDIGGGNGYVSSALEKIGVETVLLEPGKNGVRNAKGRGLKNIICAALEDIGFEKNSLPAVGLFDVVEHMKEDVEFLTMVHKYLEKNGLVFITVPAYRFLWSAEDNDAGHFRRYTTHELETKLSKIGFKPVFSTYMFSVLPMFVLLLRTIPTWLGLDKNAGDVEKHKKMHAQNKGVLEKILKVVWKWELSRLEKGNKIPFGSSCLVVAQKV